MIPLLFAALIATNPVADEPQPLSGCVWARLPAADQQQILGAYERGVSSGMNALNHRDLKVMAAAPECAGRTDLPAMWVRSAVAAHVIQMGAATAVLSEKVLIYMKAKAQEQIALTLIARMPAPRP